MNKLLLSMMTLLTITQINGNPKGDSPKNKKNTTDRSLKADAANLITIDLPKIKIYNNSSKKTTLTGITIDYKLSNETEKKSITTSAKIVIGSKKGQSFITKLKIPVSASEKNLSVEFLGISKIKIENSELEINPAWVGISESNDTIAGSEKIYFTLNGSNWNLDTKAMLNSAKNLNKPTPKTKKAKSKIDSAKKTAVAALQHHAAKNKPTVTPDPKKNNSIQGTDSKKDGSPKKTDAKK